MADLSAFDLGRKTVGSLTAAESNLENILHTICEKKWEQEVIQKKAKPHAAGWVFSQAQDCYFIKPDPAKITSQFD